MDAYIPDIFRRKTGRKYGFSRFIHIQESTKAIEHMNGKIAGDSKLQVAWARFQKKLSPRGRKESISPKTS